MDGNLVPGFDKLSGREGSNIVPYVGVFEQVLSVELGSGGDDNVLFGACCN